MRRTLFLFLGLWMFAFPCFAEVAPSTLSGRWFQKGSDEDGMLTVTVTMVEGDRFLGMIFITNVAHCIAPVKFEGITNGKNLTLKSSEKVVCGHTGVLLVDATLVDDENGKITYKGNFVYKWRGITWTKGTFMLHPDSSDKQ